VAQHAHRRVQVHLSLRHRRDGLYLVRVASSAAVL
jgi:hypothetical protein